MPGLENWGRSFVTCKLYPHIYIVHVHVQTLPTHIHCACTCTCIHTCTCIIYSMQNINTVCYNQHNNNTTQHHNTHHLICCEVNKTRQHQKITTENFTENFTTLLKMYYTVTCIYDIENHVQCIYDIENHVQCTRYMYGMYIHVYTLYMHMYIVVALMLSVITVKSVVSHATHNFATHTVHSVQY